MSDRSAVSEIRVGVCFLDWNSRAQSSKQLGSAFGFTILSSKPANLVHQFRVLVAAFRKLSLYLCVARFRGLAAGQAQLFGATAVRIEWEKWGRADRMWDHVAATSSGELPN